MSSRYEGRIVTFYNAINYGAVLQTYALKKTMSKYCVTGVYKHDNAYIDGLYSVNPFRYSGLKTKLLMMAQLPFKLIKKYRFNSFVKRRLLNSGSDSAECFYVTGSDQVWNCDCTKFDKAYFLDFAEPRFKNSYAASFGFDEIPEQHKEEYKRLLYDYNQISVREEQGRKILNDLIGRDVPVTLDPTLLLSKEEWASEFVKKNDKKYILVYSFIITESMRNFINKLSAEKGLPVVVLMPDRTLRNKYGLNNATFKTHVSPEKWVEYFYNATYVVTNSFHGTAFSINFNKDLFVELLPGRAKVNSRLTNILKLFSLEGRMIENFDDNGKAIDFDQVNDILETQRKESIAYLESIVSCYNEQN